MQAIRRLGQLSSRNDKGGCLIEGREEILLMLHFHPRNPSTNYKQVLIQTLKQATARAGIQPKLLILRLPSFQTPFLIPDPWLLA